MHIELPPMHCKECNSTNSESYETKERKGIRCLDCGHEKYTNKFDAGDVIERFNKVLKEFTLKGTKRTF
jgi:DNA-directed RNA polymerase subunit RPC12/RpoP